MFESLLGNEPLKLYLRKAVASNQVPHALMFSGSDGVGTSLFAKELAAHLLGSNKERIDAETHPDLHIVRPEGKGGLHSIEALREMTHAMQQMPFEAKAKVFLIYEAHRMQPVQANAILKTIEEPTNGTTIILLTSALQEILPTILSRCIVLRFQPLKGAEEKKTKEDVKWKELLLCILSERPFYPKLLSMLEQIEKEIRDDEVDSLFIFLLEWHRDLFAKSLSDADLVAWKNMEEAVNKARLAVSRNMKFSICLEQIFKSKIDRKLHLR